MSSSDTSKKDCLSSFIKLELPLEKIAILSDGSMAVIKCRNIDIWKDGKCINTLKEDASVFYLIILSDNTIVSAIRSRKIKIWRDSKCIQNIDVDFDIYSLLTSYNDEIIVGCKNGVVKIYGWKQSKISWLHG